MAAIRTLKLRELIEAAEPRLARAVLEVVSRIKDEHTLAQIASLVETGKTAELLAVVESHAGLLADEIVSTYVGSARNTAKIIDAATPSRVSMRFDQANPWAVARIQRRSLKTIVEFTNEQRKATSLAISDGVRRGLHPHAMARQIKGSIGLTQTQQSHVLSYRATLERGSKTALNRVLRDGRYDRAVEAAFNEGRILPQATIDKMVERYEQRYVAHRAKTIARTEALPAVHEGKDDMFRQAIESGAVKGEQLVEEWVTGGANVRDSHAEMDGQIRPFGEPFVSGDGNLLRYPGDPSAPPEDTINCKCAVVTRILREGETAEDYL